jgi:hypothetical protein
MKAGSSFPDDWLVEASAHRSGPGKPWQLHNRLTCNLHFKLPVWLLDKVYPHYPAYFRLTLPNLQVTSFLCQGGWMSTKYDKSYDI